VEPSPEVASPKRARKWIVGVVLGTLVLLAAGWLGVHRLHRALPPPIWTEADLAELAPAADDGFTTLLASSPRVGVDLDETRICAAGSHETFATVLDRQMEIRAAMLAPPAAHDVLSAAAVYDRPRLTDRCPLTALTDCSAIGLHRLHRVAELDALDLALDGEWDRALGRVEHLLRGDTDLYTHARGLITQMVALLDTREAVALLGVLVDGLAHPPAGVVPPDATMIAGHAATLLAALDALRTAHVDSSHMVAGEYVRRRADIALVAADPRLVGIGVLHELAFFDARQTMTATDDHYRALARYALHPTGAAPPAAGARAEGLWWTVWNPDGRMLLESEPDFAPRIRELATRSSLLVAECNLVRRPLALLAQR